MLVDRARTAGPSDRAVRRRAAARVIFHIVDGRVLQIGTEGPIAGLRPLRRTRPARKSRDAGQFCPHPGWCWTAKSSACDASAMSGAGTALVGRLHVDLGRMSSAICPVT
ncbi:putative leader peptide [Streptacidiphilus jiangxiensis]